LHPTGIRKRGEDAILLMVLNGYHDLVGFTLPETAGGGYWQLLIDTNLPEDPDMSAFATGEIYGVTWGDRIGVFHRDIGDSEHAEIVIADRTYRVRVGDLA
jgi:glycogen operon protein